MTAIAAPRYTPRTLSPYDEKYDRVIASATTIYHMTLVGLNSSGLVVPAGAAAVSVLGCAFANDCVSQGAAETIRIEAGVYRWAQSGTTITAAHIGTIVFGMDNQTVALAPLSTEAPAGIVVDVDSFGVWVKSGQGVGTLEVGS